MQRDIYLLTKRNADGGYLNPLEMPFYFSFQQAQYFFNFAETRIPCRPGEEIVLLTHPIIWRFSEQAFNLQQVLRDASDLEHWKVVAKRVALESNTSNVGFDSACAAVS